jgi:hypothetical protein
MRQTVSGLVAVMAISAAGIAPAMACGVYVSPCAPVYAYWCYGGCLEHDRLPDPEQQYHHPYRSPQYYYVNQGPTYTGPGAFAPFPTYQERVASGWDAYRRRSHRIFKP